MSHTPMTVQYRQARTVHQFITKSPHSGDILSQRTSHSGVVRQSEAMLTIVVCNTMRHKSQNNIDHPPSWGFALLKTSTNFI